jgi:hypothetical protein
VLLATALGGAARAQDAVFKTDELDQMLAPIALYPDSLLSQVLMTSTYPADVMDAAARSKAHRDIQGDAALAQDASPPWEPSLLAMMAERPDDVQRLGDAFVADPARVMGQRRECKVDPGAGRQARRREGAKAPVFAPTRP